MKRIILATAFLALATAQAFAEGTSRDAQLMLSRLGYQISVDGNWGPQSQRVISQFYIDRGMVYDGTLSENEFEDLSAEIPVEVQLEYNIGGIDFERSLSDTPWGFQFTDEQVRAGQRAQRFEVRPGDCGEDPANNWSDCENDRERSELAGAAWEPGLDRWLAASVYVPQDFPYIPGNIGGGIFQIHQVGGPTGTYLGMEARPNIANISMMDGWLTGQVHQTWGSFTDVKDATINIRLMRVDDMRDKWTDLMINFDTVNQNIAFFINGELIREVEDFTEFVPIRYVFKYGIYNAFMAHRGITLPTRVLYFDEVRVGNSRSEVEMRDARSAVD